jgi:hypothetical protein
MKGTYIRVISGLFLEELGIHADKLDKVYKFNGSASLA